MSELLKLANASQDVYQLLADADLNHQQAADELNDYLRLFPNDRLSSTSRTSVRRAREALGVASPHYNAGQGRTSNSVVEPAPAPVGYPRPDYSMWPEGRPALVAVVGDYQIGAHDRGFIEKQIEIIRDLQPDIIISTGDECDQSSVSRWSQGMPEQFGRTLHEERQMWVEDIAPAINEAAPNAVKRMCDSNHVRRLPMAVEKFIPGLRDAPELFVKNFLHLDELGWAFDEQPTEFLPGIVYSHGDEVMMTSRTQASKSREVIKTRQKNYIFGHTHQAGISTTALGYGFQMKTHWSLNVGHGMQLQEAKYIKSTSPDWSRGIGVVYYDGTDSFPELHLEINGKIHVDGKRY